MKNGLIIFSLAIAFFAVGLMTGKFLYQPASSEEGISEMAKSGRVREVVRYQPLELKTASSDQIAELIEKSGKTVEDKAELAQQTYRELAKSDPLETLENALGLSEGVVRRNAILTTIDEWASADSNAAFAWIAKNENQFPQLTETYAVVMGHHIKQDPDSAGNLISNMQSGSLKTSLAGQLAGEWAEKSPQSSLDWAEGLEDPVSKKIALEVALQAYAQEDVTAAFDYSLAQKDPVLRDQLLNQVGLFMARTDPEQTAGDIERFPKSVRPQITADIASSWSATAPQAAREWITAMPLGPIRDLAIERASHNLLRSDQSSSFDLAASVNDSSKRYGLVRDVLRHWHLTDPGATRTALANADRLTDEQKADLSKDLDENGDVLDLVIPSE